MSKKKINKKRNVSKVLVNPAEFRNNPVLEFYYPNKLGVDMFREVILIATDFNKLVGLEIDIYQENSTPYIYREYLKDKITRMNVLLFNELTLPYVLRGCCEH